MNYREWLNQVYEAASPWGVMPRVVGRLPEEREVIAGLQRWQASPADTPAGRAYDSWAWLVECPPPRLQAWQVLTPADVTVVITAFLRPELLARCHASVRRYYPALPIVIVDTGDRPADLPHDAWTVYRQRGDLFGNVSAARNAAVAEITTRAVWLLEDDLVLPDAWSHVPGHPAGLYDALEVLSADNEIGIVGGPLVANGRMCSYASDLELFRGTLTARPPRLPERATAGGTRYTPCDQVWNFFVARREVLAANPWDAALRMQEHAEFFWRLKCGRQWRAAYLPGIVGLHDHRGNPEYDTHRQRQTGVRRLRELGIVRERWSDSLR